MAADTPSSLEDASAIFVQTVQEVLLRFFYGTEVYRQSSYVPGM
jgi:hypothetical protein